MISLSNAFLSETGAFSSLGVLHVAHFFNINKMILGQINYVFNTIFSSP